MFCRFYQQGNCRNGNNCKFEHSNPYKYTNYGGQQQTAASNTATTGNVTTEQLLNQVSVDTNAAINGKQWLLSSYGPFKSKPNFPGLNDISPEELRFQTHEAKNNGTLIQLENQIHQSQMVAMEKLKALIKPSPIIIEAIESVYNNITPKDPFVFDQNSFGSASNQTPFNIFGGMQGNVAPTVTPNNIFAQAANSLFQQQQPTDPFANQQQPQSGFFNANTFSSQMEAAPANIFVQNQQSPFGGQNQSNSNFVAAPTPQNTFSMFNNNQNQPNPVSNVFAQQTATSVSPASIFANANAALTQSSPIVPANVFEKPVNSEANSNPFGVNLNSSFTQNQNTNVFGNVNSNVFGNKEVLDESVYSKMEELSQEEIDAFKSDMFQKGKIPENPPPLELCN